jgi:hypothetical protein
MLEAREVLGKPMLPFLVSPIDIIEGNEENVIDKFDPILES